MSWWNDFATRMEHDTPVGSLTWFKFGGRARHLFHPKSAEDLASLVVRARHEEQPVKVLGRGANVLVRDDGVDGVVVRLDHASFKTVDWRGDGVRVGAGVDLMPHSRECSERGLSGLECMAGIPATVGGAIRMNAGGEAGAFGSVVREADMLSPNGEIETWAAERFRFGYRRSELEGRVVLSATLDLQQADPGKTERRYAEFFDFKRKSQPLAENSAGCIFKNPVGKSAGALIDRAGLKGERSGGAQVSQRHANFIVADRGTTSSDVLRLIDVVRERVARVFEIDLELEIDVW